VIRCVASFKSEKFEFEDEPPQISQITGQKSKHFLGFYQEFYQILFPIWEEYNLEIK